MNDWENDAFRMIEFGAKLDWAMHVLGQYREGIDHVREKIDYFNKMLGWLSGRRGDPEPRPPKEQP